MYINNQDMAHTLLHSWILWNLHLSCGCSSVRESCIQCLLQVSGAICVSSLCYSVKSHSAEDLDRGIGTVNQSNRERRKWQTKSKAETCLKAISSIEVDSFGFMSHCSNILFPWVSQIIYTKDLLTSRRGSCKATLSERQDSLMSNRLGFGARPIWVVIPDLLFISFVDLGNLF